MINELGIYFRPGAASTKKKAAWKQLITSVVIFAILVVVQIAFFLGAFGEGYNRSVWIIVVVLTIALIPIALRLISFLELKKAAISSDSGLALGINREGILAGQRWLPWAEVGEMRMESARWGGSDRLVITARDNQSSLVLFSFTDTMPGSLASAIITLSAGRVRVDLSKLDA